MHLPLLYILVSLTAYTHAWPARGHYPFAVALCYYSDKQDETMTPDYVRQFLTSADPGSTGLYRYLQQQSSGAFDIEGTIVKGWYKVPLFYSTVNGYTRGGKIKACRDAAVAAGLVIPSTHRFMAIYNAVSDTGYISGSSTGSGVLLQGDDTAGTLCVSLTAQYVLSAVGEPNSKLASQTGPPSNLGDQFDLMSTPNIYTQNGGVAHGNTGPNLAAPGRDRLGWIPQSRIYTPPRYADRIFVSLSTLSAPDQHYNFYLMIRIPTGSGPPWSYYTFEYRTADDYDLGFTKAQNLNSGFQSNNGVVVHQVNETDEANWLFYPYFATPGKSFSYFHRVGDSFIRSNPFINVTVLRTNTIWADLEISVLGQTDNIPYGPNTCGPGLVWREGDALDYVCVSPARRTQVKSDNAQAANRRCCTGNYNCIAGYVWRQAWPLDYVCVTPGERSTAQSESKAAYQYVANDYFSSSIADTPLGPVIP